MACDLTDNESAWWISVGVWVCKKALECTKIECVLYSMAATAGYAGNGNVSAKPCNSHKERFCNVICKLGRIISFDDGASEIFIAFVVGRKAEADKYSCSTFFKAHILADVHQRTL